MAEIDLTGKILDERYRVVAPLGAGGMGAVYLARDQRLERKVVVKVPHPSLLADEKFRARFALEVRSLVDLSHPHIVKVSDAGEIDDVPYVVIEFHGGGSLSDRLGDEPMHPAEVLAWLPDVARALDHIHEKGVIHRDVKPGNLLFDEKGNAYLSDFGISKALLQPAPGLTVTGASPGSPGYIPPEAQGLEIDGRYDQFSLAAVVFRCVTGRRLKPHDPYVGVWKELSSGLPGGAADAVEKALSPDPADRFPSCEQFATALATGLSDTGPQGVATPESATIATGAPMGEDGEPERTESEPEPPAPPRSKRGVTIAFICLLMVVLGAAGYVYLELRPPRVELTGGGAVAGPRVEVATPLPVTGRATVEVRGRLRNAPGGHVLVAGRRVDPDGEGLFGATVALEPGDNAVEVVGVTSDGERTKARTLRVFLDREPPRVEILSPEGPLVTREARVEIHGRLTDARLHPGRAIVGEREVRVDPSGEFRIELALEEGSRTVAVRATDRAGNVSEPVEVVVTRDTTPPAITLLSPGDGLLTRTPRVAVSGRAEDGNLERVLVNDAPVAHDAEGVFETAIALAEGPNTILVRATDRAGNEATARAQVTLDATSPALEILAPGPALRTEEAKITVRGSVAAGRKGTLTVAGRPVTPAADGSFSVVVPLEPGENGIEIALTDPAGNRTTKEIRVIRGRPQVTLEVLEPADGVVTRLGRVAVRVRFAGAPAARITVNGRLLEPDGEGVRAGEVELAEGDNRLEIVAEEPATGRRAERRVFVRRDTTRPEVGAVGLAVGAEPGTVRLEGELGESGCVVAVGDEKARVDGRRYSIDVALPPGESRIVVRVTDAAGNESTATRAVISGPTDVDTDAGSELRLLDGCVIEPLDSSGEEAYRLLVGVLQGQLAERTRIVLPAGRLRAPPGGRAQFLAETTEGGGAKVRCRGSGALVSLGEWLLIELKVSQAIEVRPGKGSGRSLGFATPDGNPREVHATILVSRELQVELRVPGGVSGEIRDVDLGKRTLIAVSESTPAGKAVVVSQIVGGRRGGLKRVAPGESVAVDHE